MIGIRDFFDSAVLIDDELDPAASQPPDPNNVSQRPWEVISTFQEEGIVISPLHYTSVDQEDQAVRLALRAKLTILDWELIRGRKGVEASGPANEIIRRVVEEKDEGMQWIIVYTREEIGKLPEQLLSYLKQRWQNHERLKRQVDVVLNSLKAEEQSLNPPAGVKDGAPELLGSAPPSAASRPRTAPGGDVHELPILLNGVLITFVNKAIDSKQLFYHFEKSLKRVFGPMAGPLLRTASEIEKNSYRVIERFAMPFELSIFLHVLTADLSMRDIGPLVLGLFADGILEASGVTEAVTEEMRSLRKAALDEAAVFVEEHSEDFRALVSKLQEKGRPLRSCLMWPWARALRHVSQHCMEHNIARCLTNEILSTFNIPREAYKAFPAALEIVAAYVQWRKKHSGKSPEDFLVELKEQASRFTALLKFRTDIPLDQVVTGGIYRDKLSSNKYLLCITPYCDVAHPNRIRHHYKFLVGEAIKDWSPEQIENIKKKQYAHGTFIPSEAGVQFVEWEFFNTLVMPVDKDNVMSQWKQAGFSHEYLREHQQALTSELATAAEELRLAVLEVAAGSTDSHFVASVAAELRLLEHMNSGEGYPEDLSRILEHAGRVNSKSLLSKAASDADFFARYEPITLLKKEYAQQIINKYVAYHSRAGVEEIYYKEWPVELSRIFS